MSNKKSRFKVIEGGLSAKPAPPAFDPGQFMVAYATNSRLMGVCGLIIQRQLTLEDGSCQKLFQIFYFDAEEFGFDTYKKVITPMTDKFMTSAPLQQTIGKMFGGLGSDYVLVNEEEAYFLVNHYARYNKERNMTLPGAREEYQYILDMNTLFTQAQLNSLFQRISVPIRSTNQLVNYFVMRNVGRDINAARFLAEDNKYFPVIPFPKGAVLMQNTIDRAYAPGPNSSLDYQTLEARCGPLDGDYLCESLVEYNDRYYNFVTKVTVKKCKVSDFQLVSQNEITATEATLITKKDSYIMVFDLADNPSKTMDLVETVFPGSLINIHENGTLAIIFHNDNDHVCNRTYRLNDDVYAMVLITSANELIFFSNEVERVAVVSALLLNKNGGIDNPPKAEKIGFFKFPFPILPMYLDTEYDGFMEFLQDLGQH